MLTGLTDPFDWYTHDVRFLFFISCFVKTLTLAFINIKPCFSSHCVEVAIQFEYKSFHVWHPVVPWLRMTENVPWTDILLLIKSQTELTI